MKKLIFSDEEMKTIMEHGETCQAVAETAMKKAGLCFDDIEEINQRWENYRWGSDRDRLYRKQALKKAIAAVAKNPLKYI